MIGWYLNELYVPWPVDDLEDMSIPQRDTMNDNEGSGILGQNDNDDDLELDEINQYDVEDRPMD